MNKLRRIRREKGYSSVEALADAVGVSHMAVAHWETGHVKHPRDKGKYRHAQRLEAVLQTPIDVLLSPDTETETTTPKGGRREVNNYTTGTTPHVEV